MVARSHYLCVLGNNCKRIPAIDVKQCISSSFVPLREKNIIEIRLITFYKYDPLTTQQKKEGKVRGAKDRRINVFDI